MKYKDFADKNTPILVWPFRDAPPELRGLSTNGGDEDWVVLMPAGLCEWARWIEATDTCYEPQRFELDDGSIVFIGSHA